MDVLNVVKTGENYRLLYDEKGRFTLVKVNPTEANFKLCKVVSKAVGPNKIPYIVTHDSRTIRFPHPDIK
jgi:small subunit ribosomal protein S4e